MTLKPFTDGRNVKFEFSIVGYGDGTAVLTVDEARELRDQLDDAIAQATDEGVRRL